VNVAATPIVSAPDPYVPMPKPEPILSYSQTETQALMQRLTNPVQNNDALVAEISGLRSDLKAANSAIAQNTKDTAKMLNQFNGEGMPETRTL
jgi:hypothetical protein